jgi:hypothetical protein
VAHLGAVVVGSDIAAAAAAEAALGIVVAVVGEAVVELDMELITVQLD